MRKLASILMLFIMLFNLAGYRLLFSYLEDGAQAQMDQRIDNQQYSEASLIEIKIPLQLPYADNWSGFQRFDGSVEFNGQHYNYVQRRIYNDTLIIRCLPNQLQNSVSNAAKEYGRVANEQGGNTKTNNLLKMPVAEYNRQNIFYQSPISDVQPKYNNAANENIFTNTSPASPWQPPDII